MKKRLLSFFVFAFVGLMLQAASWTAPTIQLVTDQIPEKAYIYNVEQGKFLTKGGAWGNHACVKADVSGAFLYELQLQEDGESYKLYCAAADKQHLLGRESAEDVYTDYNNQAAWGILWEFKAVSGGYEIYSAHACPNFGADKYTDDETNFGVYKLGYNPERPDLTNGTGAEMGTFDGVYMVDPTNCEGYSCTWAFMTEEIYAVYNSQMALYNKLNEAIGAGYTEAELKEYADLLTSTDSDALAQAVEAVSQLILDYAYNHASPDNPVDITDVIKNPTFEGSRGAEPAGWIDEYGNMLIQNNKAYPIVDDEGNDLGEYGLNNFSQNWTSSATDPIAASKIYQVISNLPQGSYILQVDGIATSASASLQVSGAGMFAESGAAHYFLEFDKNPYGVTGAGNPHRYQMFVTHMGGDLTIGADFTPGYVKWFAVDNFRLYYAGPVDNPGLVALSSAVSAAQPYVDEYEETYYYSEETFNTLKSELDKAGDTMSGTSDECLEEAGKVNAMVTTVKAEVAAYNKLKALYEKVESDMQAYENIAALSEKLSEMLDEYKGAYEDKVATVEQIEAWVAGYNDVVVNGVKAAMATATEENPIEITCLFKNLAFEENTNESAAPTNWESNSGNFKARANTAEVWNVSFDAHTTLTDLPAGAYRITSHGLSRSGSSVENYATLGADVTAEFYANNSSVKVVSQHVGAGAEQRHSSDVNLTEDEENPLWSPNSMEGARVYFNVAETPYVNTVTASLIKDGDPLVVGYRDLGDASGTVAANSWTIWSDVRVYYIGVSSDALYNEMLALAETAVGYEEGCMVNAAVTKLEDAAQAAEKLPSTASEAEIVAAINQLNEAIDYMSQGKTLISDLMALYENYSGKVDEIESSDTKFPELIEEVGSAISSEEFDSNEQIQGWLDSMAAAWTAYIQYDHLNATEENPADISAVLTNNSFQLNNANGWTVTNTGGSIGGGDAQRTGSTAYEAWNATAFDIHQKVVGLADGYYRLSCKALFRNGNNSDDLAAAYYAEPEAVQALAQFYANDNTVNVKNIYEEAQAEDPAIDGQTTFVRDGVTYYTANTMISFENYAMNLGLYSNTLLVKLEKGQELTIGLRYETTASYAWFPFDDFKVEYLGGAAPTAVEALPVADKTASAIFDLSGRKVSKAIKGIYVVDGKKVVK